MQDKNKSHFALSFQGKALPLHPECRKPCRLVASIYYSFINILFNVQNNFQQAQQLEVQPIL